MVQQGLALALIATPILILDAVPLRLGCPSYHGRCLGDQWEVPDSLPAHAAVISQESWWDQQSRVHARGYDLCLVHDVMIATKVETVAVTGGVTDHPTELRWDEAMYVWKYLWTVWPMRQPIHVEVTAAGWGDQNDHRVDPC